MDRQIKKTTGVLATYLKRLYVQNYKYVLFHSCQLGTWPVNWGMSRQINKPSCDRRLGCVLVCNCTGDQNLCLGSQIGHFVCETWGVISFIYLAVYERIHYRPPLVTWIISKKIKSRVNSFSSMHHRIIRSCQVTATSPIAMDTWLLPVTICLYRN